MSTSCLLKYFGTDLKLAGWFIFAAAALYLSIISYYCYYVNSINPIGAYFTVSSVFILLMGGISYFFASMVLLSLFLNITKIRIAIKSTKIENLGIMRKYFHGNPLLIATWLFFIPTILYFLIPILAFIAHYITVGELIASFIALSIMSMIFFLWVYSTFPENLLKNGGNGSSFFLETFCCTCQGWEKYLKDNWGSDFLIAVRLIRAIGIQLSVLAMMFSIFDPSNVVLWLLFVSAVFFTTGVFILTLTAFTAELDSTYIIDFIQGKATVLEAENAPLIPVP